MGSGKKSSSNDQLVLSTIIQMQQMQQMQQQQEQFRKSQEELSALRAQTAQTQAIAGQNENQAQKATAVYGGTDSTGTRSTNNITSGISGNFSTSSDSLGSGDDLGAVEDLF